MPNKLSVTPAEFAAIRGLAAGLSYDAVSKINGWSSRGTPSVLINRACARLNMPPRQLFERIANKSILLDGEPVVRSNIRSAIVIERAKSRMRGTGGCCKK